jgi:hypothetical protein
MAANSKPRRQMKIIARRMIVVVVEVNKIKIRSFVWG